MADSNTGIDAMIRLARNDGREALGRLLENYRAYLRILAQRGIGLPLARRIDASDIVQQTFLEAQRDFAHFLGITEPELVAWLTRILEHNLAEMIRSFTSLESLAFELRSREIDLSHNEIEFLRLCDTYCL